MLLRQDVVSAGLKKPAMGAGITDASLPLADLRVGTNLTRWDYRIQRQQRATEYTVPLGIEFARIPSYTAR